MTKFFSTCVLKENARSRLAVAEIIKTAHIKIEIIESFLKSFYLQALVAKSIKKKTIECENISNTIKNVCFAPYPKIGKTLCGTAFGSTEM